MKISVIVPFFNDELYLGACIESIKEQLCCDLDVVLVDDCGSDRSSQIALKAIDNDSRFKMIIHDKNRGLAAARNSGIDQACGDYLFFLDADDKLASKTSLSDLSDAAEGFQIVQGDYIRSTKEVVFGENNWTNATNKLIDAKWLKENKLYFVDGIIYEDVVWAMTLYALPKKVAYINKPTYFHNLRSGSIMRSDFNEKKVESLLFVIDVLKQLNRDIFVVDQIVKYEIFLLKNLLMGNFDKRYKRLKYNEIKKLGVFNLKSKEGLPKFSSILFGVRNSFHLSSLLCDIYKIWKRF